MMMMNRKFCRCLSVAAFITGCACSANANTNRPAAPHAPVEALARLNESLQDLAARVSPAVVQIEVATVGSSEERDRRGIGLIVRQRAIGAGIIVDPDGYIMTNAHVVAGARRIRAVLAPAGVSDGENANPRTLDARLLGLHRESDLALLKIDADNLPTVRFGLALPQPGSLVFAIGSPEGLRNSVTMGVLSSAVRQPDPDTPMTYLQTDAPINPGNSGGPLVDVTGAVVGLNTFILSKGGGSEGLGFAIPARVVDFVYRSLRKSGHVDHVDIGASAQTITPALAQGLGLGQERGVVISDVLPYGPASSVGITVGDVVAAVDGHFVPDLATFTAALYLHPADEPLRIDVLRGAQKLPFEVPSTLARDRVGQLADVADPVESRVGSLGILAVNLNERLRSVLPTLRSRTGVIVIGHAPGLDAVETDLEAGDVIRSLNDSPITSVERLKSAVAQVKAGQAVVLQIERAGRLQYVAFEME